MLVLNDLSCPHSRGENVCQVATNLAGVTAKVLDDRACKVCSKLADNRQPNRVTASLALQAIRSSGGSALLFFEKSHEFAKYLTVTPKEQLQDAWEGLSEGLGRFTKQVFGFFKINPPPGCDCLKLAELMNNKGDKWCRENKRYISGAMLSSAFSWVVYTFAEFAKYVYSFKFVKSALELVLFVVFCGILLLYKVKGKVTAHKPADSSSADAKRKVTAQLVQQIEVGKVKGQTTTRVYVIGYPSDVGGADTELLHTVGVWRRQGIDVTLIPTWGQPNVKHRALCDLMGCRTVVVDHASAALVEVIPAGSTVISFCNAGLLGIAATLHRLQCKIIWVGCMCWPFDKEKEYYLSSGKTFEQYVFQSQYQRSQLEPHLLQFPSYQIGKGNLIHGAFDFDRWDANSPDRHTGDAFVFGRLARADKDKWSSNTWHVYNNVKYKNKVALVMGVDNAVSAKLGIAPEWVSILQPGVIPSETFFNQLHCLLPINGGAKENWPRTGLEAMASGCPIVTQNEWGWREMLTDREIGFLCDTDEQLADYTTMLAEDEPFRQTIGKRAKEFLQSDLANESKIASQWLELFEKVQS